MKTLAWKSLLRSTPLRMLLRVCVLIFAVGFASVSVNHAHPGNVPAVADATAMEAVLYHECCHEVDHGSASADCAVSHCQSPSALSAIGLFALAGHPASERLALRSINFVSCSFPPILHPPITV